MTLDLTKVESNSSPKTDFGRVEDGSYPARIVSVIDIGTQHITDWQTQKPRYHELDEEGKWAKKGDNFVFTTTPNEAPDLKPQVMITFELPTERIDIEKDGETQSLPRWMSKEYTMSSHEKAGLMKLVSAVAPGIQKLGDLVDKPCLISVGSTSSGNAKITGVAAPMKGMQVDPLENEATVFSFDESTAEDFSKLQNWVQNKIRKATNFDASKFEVRPASQPAESKIDDFDDDSAPF